MLLEDIKAPICKTFFNYFLKSWFQLIIMWILFWEIEKWYSQIFTFYVKIQRKTNLILLEDTKAILRVVRMLKTAFF